MSELPLSEKYTLTIKEAAEYFSIGIKKMRRLAEEHVDSFSIYRVQIPNITPHVCRHTYCSNMARAGMNPKTLQYLMGYSDISITMNTYTHLGLDDAKDEMIRLKELEEARREIEKTTEKPKPANQNMFRAV